MGIWLGGGSGDRDWIVCLWVTRHTGMTSWQAEIIKTDGKDEDTGLQVSAVTE